MKDILKNETYRSLLVGLFLALRRRFFSVGRGESVTFTAQGSTEAVLEAFFRAGFTGPWHRSYHYEGEDVNLVRFRYDPQAYPGLPHRQDHVRLFIDEYPDGEIGVAAHSEPSSLAHRGPHLREETFSRGEGIRRAKLALHASGVSVEDASPAGGGEAA